jgi:DtxR family Mn-dependent transcriptional regulator
MTNICPSPRSKSGESSSLEDYLEMLLVLTRESGASVRITDLSERLGVSKPSASAAVKKLAEAGYASHERYGDVRLTPAGQKRAEEVASRHILLHRFLAVVLGVDEETAQADACRLEHDLSEETVQRLAAFVEHLVARNTASDEQELGVEQYLVKEISHADSIDSA